MKKVIVNVYSEGREKYEELTKGLINSVVEQKLNYDIFTFSPLILEDMVVSLENTVCLYKNRGWPYCEMYGQSAPHSEIQHQFKAFAIQAVRELGYTQVMWCDSPVRIVKNPEKFFGLAEELGAVTFDAEPGATESIWTSDKCLEVLGCSPEYARTFNQCSSGVMLFDFSNKRGCAIFDEFAKYCLSKEALDMKGGSDRVEFMAHRSDQSIISYVMRKYNMYNLPWGSYMHRNSFLKKNPYGIQPTFFNGD